MHITKEKCEFYEQANVWKGLFAPCFVLEETGSVLDDAWALVQKNMFPVWSSVLASCQNAGRGQTRRPWQSPKGNLYVALRLPNEHPFDNTAAAPALSSLIIHVLQSIDCVLHLKWPNDLVNTIKLQKVGGILLEEKQGVIIAGIGINIKHAPSLKYMREGAALMAGNLMFSTEQINKINQGNTFKELPEVSFTERFWLYLVRKMYFCYTSESPEGWGKLWQDKANEVLLWKGQNVYLDDGHKKLYGTLSSLGTKGELELMISEEKQSFFNGSLSSL